MSKLRKVDDLNGRQRLVDTGLDDIGNDPTSMFTFAAGTRSLA
jgi:hypothetical protein